MIEPRTPCWTFIVVQSFCPILCDPMDCSTPGVPVSSLSPGACSNSCPLISDAIQPSHPLLPAFMGVIIYFLQEETQ